MQTARLATGEGSGQGATCRERAEGYDRHLATLRRKLATFQGGYLQAVRREAEQTHDKWLLANQDVFAEELRRGARSTPHRP
jgi:hypothetical protein